MFSIFTDASEKQSPVRPSKNVLKDVINASGQQPGRTEKMSRIDSKPAHKIASPQIAQKYQKAIIQRNIVVKEVTFAEEEQ